jgi:hypothetical protein
MASSETPLHCGLRLFPSSLFYPVPSPVYSCSSARGTDIPIHRETRLPAFAGDPIPCGTLALLAQIERCPPAESRCPCGRPLGPYANRPQPGSPQPVSEKLPVGGGRLHLTRGIAWFGSGSRQGAQGSPPALFGRGPRWGFTEPASPGWQEPGGQVPPPRPVHRA